MSFLKRFFSSPEPAPDEPVEQGGRRGESAATELRAVEHRLIPAGREAVLVAPIDRRIAASLVSPEEADLLRRCQRYDTLEKHATRLGDRAGIERGGASELVGALEVLAERGLLQPREPLTAGVNDLAEEPLPRLERLVVLTSERVEAARRCVQSYAGAARESGRELDIALFDDSKSEGWGRRYESLCDELERSEGVSITRVGVEDRRALVDRLAAAGFPRHVVEFGLLGEPELGWTTGANHNATLLFNVGSAFSTADDDTIAELLAGADAEGALELSSKMEPTDFWFFEDAEAAIADERCELVDPLSLHEELLGKSVLRCAAESAAGVRVEEARERLQQALRDERSRVAITTLGLRGDSGMGSSRYYLFLRGASRRRLVADDGGYGRRRLTRWVRRCVPRPTITDSHFLMMPCVGLDNRQCLPPFFPVLRNHDGVMGVALHKVAPQLHIGHLPWMVGHRPPVVRENSLSANLEGASRWTMSTLAIQCIMAWRCPGGGDRVEERLVSLGRHLLWLASLELDEFRDFALERARIAASRAIDHLERSLGEQGEQPAEWAADVDSTIEAMLETLPSRDLVTPTDLSPRYQGDAALAFGQQLIGRYGELLLYWPEICAVQKTSAFSHHSPFTFPVPQ